MKRARRVAVRSALGLAALTGAGALAGCSGEEAGDSTMSPAHRLREAGVPAALAEARQAAVSDLRYDLSFSIPARRDSAISGRASIGFALAAPTGITLDFAADPDQVGEVRVNDAPVEAEVTNEHIFLPARAFVAGRNTVDIPFVAGEGSLNRNDELLYTLFVPDRARWAFPLFDQPDLKARYRLTLQVPDGWRAVANGAVEEERAIESEPGSAGGTTYRFAETQPIPSYLFSFAAGVFEVTTRTVAGREMRLYHRETDSARVARNLDAIFDLHGTAIEWLEAYTEIPYPFGKFDFVAVPSFQYGGMEHPGAILYRANSLFLDESATRNDYLGRASVIAHETAHMWFGDLVTMRWFDDVWMKEVFANFMAARIVHPSFPDIDHDLRFMLAHHPAAYAIDRSEGANPIRQPLDNLNEAGTLYGAIIYQKAPIVMRQLERLVGEEEFRAGLAEYLDRFRFANATWPELIEILDRRSPLDLDAWSRTWVEQPGRPTVHVSVAEAGGDSARLTARQEDPHGRGRQWPQEFEVAAGPAPVRNATVALVDGASDVTLGGGSVDWLIPNADGYGYGRFPLTDATREALLDGTVVPTEPKVRAAAWLALWEDLLHGAATPIGLVEHALERIGAEDEELLLARVLSDSRPLFWRFLTPAQRARQGPRFEAAIWARLERARTVSMRATLFSAYRDLATTSAALARLTRIWEAGEGLPSLPLSERDYTRLAQVLALHEVAGAEGILDRQAGRIENADLAGRFAYVRPALSPDPAMREAFFHSLADPANREREPWVLEGLAFLHHPLRAEASLPFVRPGLEMLEEIQRTGDIFFPKRWLDATLGGHASTGAAEAVRGFLQARPDYPPRLRLKVLQASDMLFRAAGARSVARAAP